MMDKPCDSLSIVFDGVGWATLTFSSNTWRREIVASYIAASPFDFLIALENLDKEDDSTTLNFNAEPEVSTVQILWDPTDKNSRPDSLAEAYQSIVQIEIYQKDATPIELPRAYARGFAESQSRF